MYADVNQMLTKMGVECLSVVCEKYKFIVKWQRKTYLTMDLNVE